jgi:hypothetical protein
MAAIKRIAWLDPCSLCVHVACMDEPALAPGFLLARGVARALDGLGFVAVPEFVLANGLRVDLMALGPKGEIWIIECKSSLADFRADQKWQGYLPWCDRFFWAVCPDFPRDILPDGSGLFLADGYGAALMQFGDETRLAPARRKALTLAVSRAAARRLHRHADPQAFL